MLATKDRREFPVYSLSEVAYYLGIKEPTLHSWIRGRAYPTEYGQRRSVPLIDVHGRAKLSFFNLIEAHILLFTRTVHGLSIHQIRKAIDYVQEEFPSQHPLITEKFKTDGKYLFIERLGSTINASKYGQLYLPVLDQYLKRINWDASGLPVRFFPFKRGMPDQSPPLVMIDPMVSSGRPVIKGTGILTSILLNRRKAGETTSELAEDYGLKVSDIEEAIEYFAAA